MAGGQFSDSVVFESPLVSIGAFRCDRDYSGFQDTGPVRNDCFVFPRTAVRIEHEDAAPFVANPNIVTFYNRSQRYLRHEISERGDRCDWFGIRRDIARDAVRSVDPAVEEDPFRWHRGRCDAKTYLIQRRLFDAVSNGAIPDPLAVEETVLMLLDRAIAGATPAETARKQGELVREVEWLLAARFEQPVSLAQVATDVGVSVYHLCRTFRDATGFTLHQYLLHLRIRHGLERVCETRSPLSRIAVDLGFAHHSHFTSAFRRGFDVTPSQLRAAKVRYG